MSFTLRELGERFGLAVRGDADTRIEGVATIDSDAPHRLTFLANPKYRAQLATSRVAAIVLREADAAAWPRAALVAADPYAAFA